ncbi:MAG: Fic family protein [Candidatus Altiarchaeales archaeon HGW-Altiarchaeales-1]|nr:MAG: Fic family protein [Candidatus Altiarchaeales archaeon HGW-Altiarchaeales-1]
MFTPKFVITNRTNNNLAEIERARGFLEAAELKTEWLSRMQKRALILESHHSTHIEGTELTFEQAEKILSGEKVEGVDADDEMELFNYKQAMDYVSGYVKVEELVTGDIIRDIHKILVEGVRGGSADPGNYRTIQNYIVNSRTREVIYTPPHASEVEKLMDELIDWINSAKDISPIIVAGIAQFQFVHIHPFLDGNGRTARLLCTLILYKTGYDFKKLFSISEYYDKNRKDYYDAIQNVRENNMDMTSWIEYFTDALKSQMVDVKNRGEKIIKKDLIRERVRNLNLNKRQIKILEYLTDNDSITREQYVKMFDISLRTANYDISEIEKLNLIKRAGIGRATNYMLK